MKSYWKNYLFFLGAALFLGSPLFLRAADSPMQVGLSVDQAAVAFDASSGETHTFSLKVTNTMEKNETVSLEAFDLSIGDDNRIAAQATSNEARGLKNWIRADQVALKLSPGESRQVFLTVVVPQDAVVGSHAGIVLARALPEITGENFQKVLVSGQVGTYLLVNVKGEVSGKGRISSFSAPVFAGKKAFFQVDYQNQGNIHYVPHGEIVATNLLNQNASKLKIDQHFVFPGRKYSFVEQWDLPSVLGVYRVRASFVDGEGLSHSDQRYVIGALFPAALLGVSVCGGLFIWRMRKRVKKEKNV